MVQINDAKMKLHVHGYVRTCSFIESYIKIQIVFTQKNYGYLHVKYMYKGVTCTCTCVYKINVHVLYIHCMYRTTDICVCTSNTF